MIPRDVAHTILCLCEEVNTPRALTVSLLLKHNELGQLVSLTTDPAHYTNSNAFFRDVLVSDVLRKCRGFETGVDLRAAAVSAFWQSERSCYRSNERLTPFIFGACPEGVSGRVWEVLSLARKYVAFVLGACPNLPPPGKFGPGATFADRGFYTTVPDKMSSSPTLTSDALGVIPSWAHTSWARAVSSHGGSLDLVRGNRFTTVPKDSVKDRGIAIEPSLNVFYQLGYGAVIRQRLLRVGIDLRGGQDIHRAKAREASARGNLATIDLSSASDTVCTALVELLLPRPWFQALASLRSPFTNVDGKWVKLEKFSSMGNGYTFELETLVFLALSFSVMALGGHLPKEGDNLLVYGDDIIVPRESYSDVLGVLSFCGFQPNRRKSFSEGSFRESCGGDFFDGRPVRAFFLKELPSEPHQWIAFANGLRRVVMDHHFAHLDERFYLRTWRTILDSLPSSIRDLRGPARLGDIVVHDSPSKWRPKSCEFRDNRLRPIGSFSPSVGDGIRYFKTWSPVSYYRVGWKHFRPEVTLATALYGVGDGLLGVTPRDSVTGYGERWVPSS
jgi:hypothetical protein